MVPDRVRRIVASNALAPLPAARDDDMSTELKPQMEAAISVIVSIINEAVTSSGMSREETEALRQALRDLVVAIRGNQ